MSQPHTPFSESDVQRERASGWSIASLILGIGSFCLWIIAGIPAIICGIVGLSKSSQPGVGGRGLAITGIVTGSLGSLVVFPIIGILLALLLPAIQAAREAARRQDSTNRLRQQSLAMIMYQEENRMSLPAAYGSAAGPPSSWRTEIAPYLEAGQIYDQYDFQQPWDSEQNLPLTNAMPMMFRNPNLLEPGLTNYLVLVGDGTAFPPNEAVGELQDASSTILIVEADADRAVPWTKPQDIDYDPDLPFTGLGNFRPGVFIVAFADGSTRSISDDIDPDLFRALVTRAGDDNSGLGSFFRD